MRKVGVIVLVLLVVLAGVSLPSPAMAWGSPGHGVRHVGGRPSITFTTTGFWQ
jgi:hypothetical protein